jgi:hypothetical protein
MDKDRVKRLCESILDISYSGTTIKNFDMTPRFKYDDGLDKWVPDSHALFIQVNRHLSERIYGSTDIQKTLEGVLGFECCVDFV